MTDVDAQHHKPLQDNCAVLTNYTLATAPSLNTVYNATGLVIVITVRRFFWCAFR